MDEANRRFQVTPACGACLVSISVPPKVESGTGAKLENPESPAGAVSDLEEPTKQGRAAPNLVGLASPRQQLTNLRAPVDQRRAKGRPCLPSVAIPSG
jgi:hypothetical protein